MKPLLAAFAIVVGVVAANAAEPRALAARGICAHRGASATHPENTVPALEEAVRLGAHMVEIDLALTRDGEFVLMHDPTVNRTTDGQGAVRDFDLAALRKLDAGRWKDPRFAGTRVPTLAEAFAAVPRHVWINLDVKADARFGDRLPETIRRVVAQIMAEGRQAQVFLAVRSDAAAIAREAAPGIRICNMDRAPDPAAYVRAAIAQRADFIQLRDCAKDPRLPAWIAELHAARVKVNYYYADQPEAAASLFAAGVDFVLVNHVETLLPQLPQLAPELSALRR